ncbi:YCF48-related protein [Sinomicrobium sp. M5D2P9]
MRNINKYIPIISIFLLLLFFSCSKDSYIDISEVPEIELSTISTTHANHSFVNTANNQDVSILNSLDETGFHFYNSFKFKTEAIGILVGGTGLRARITQDGGMSWTEFRFSKFANAFHSVSFSDNAVFIVGESKYIFRSTDFGKNWSVYNSEVLFEGKNSLVQHKFYKIRFISETVGFIAGERDNVPVLLKTNDGGEQWEIVNDNESLKNSGAITDFFIHSHKELIIVTSLGKCYKTNDGGTHWELVYETNPLNSIAFKNKNTGFTGGINGTLHYTGNGGKNWSTIKVPENPNITDIVFLGNTALITTSISFTDNRDAFVYKIDENGKNIQPFLTKSDDNVLFMGDSYTIDVLNNNVYILDRNNLYKTIGD